MKKTRFSALLAAVLIFSTMPLFAAKTPATEIKLISYNIRTALGKDGENSWNNRCHATLNLISREAPDVFGLQEALNEQLHYIETACPQYARVGVGRDDGVAKGETMAIYYLRERFDLLDSGTLWLSQTPDVVSRGWDAARNRTVTWVHLLDKATGRDFFYFNTHLDHRGRIAREESAKLLVTKMKEIAGKQAAVVLGGDFNSASDSPALAPIGKFMASARDKARSTDHKGTFNGFGTAPDTIIIDQLFFRGRMECLRYATLDGDFGAPYISDHNPIELVFRLK